jgi:putative aldouronate transport system permease protein
MVKTLKDIAKNKYIYILLTPGLLFYIIFCYFPLYGIQLAFKDFWQNLGIWGSPFVGLANFDFIMKEPQFWNAFRNTLIISAGKIIFGFPVPIILAIIISELRFRNRKRIIQTILTFPHFLSWVIIAGFIRNLFNSSGAVNGILGMFGVEKIDFFASNIFFVPLLFFTEIWKESGWASIIYIATISGINSESYEAADVDGANRLQKIFHITWPGIKSTAIMLLVLSVGGILSSGFDQIFNLYNPLVYPVSDIIDTYIYRLTFETALNQGVGVAIGLFKSVASFLLLIMADRIAKAAGERGVM